MGNPACYSDAELTQLIAEFGRGPATDSNEVIQRADITTLTTGRGVKYHYTVSKYRNPVYKFFVPRSLLVDFETLYAAAVTDETKVAFYFVRDGDDLSPPEALHCTIQNDFEPEPAGMWSYNGVIEQWFVVTLELEEVISAADIED